MTSVATGKMSSGPLSRALVPMQGDVENCDSKKESQCKTYESKVSVLRE